jgi:hypothetical protein
MKRCIILRRDSRGDLEKDIEKFANKYTIEHMSFSTLVFPDYSTEYSCCLIYSE